MIKNQPSPDDFESIAIQCLVQALDLIHNKEKELEFLEDEADIDEYWKYHQGILNNALTLLFLSLENFLKKEISNISPLMLLADRPTNWGVRGRDKNYNDIFIHQFDDLLVLYQELGLGEVSAQTAEKLEDLRKKRNKITHGIIEENITPLYVVNVFHTIVYDIWGNGEWWEKLKQYVFNEPLFGVYDSEYEKACLVMYVHFLKSYLSNNQLSEVFGVSLSQRNYFCPSCEQILVNEDLAEQFESKFAILLPNEEDSTNIYCLICNGNFVVEREDCLDQECHGNVITTDDKLCLSCFTYADDHA